MGKTIVFLTETPGSMSIEDQEAHLGENDLVVPAGRRRLSDLSEILAHNRLSLEPGDRVKLFELPCLALATTQLIRELVKLLRNGITVEIVAPALILEPGNGGQGQTLLEALDGHYRHMHGIKTHPSDTAPQGRKRLLDSAKLPEILAMLDKPGATHTTVAETLGVARSTLFNFLTRHNGGGRRRGAEKVVKRHTKRAGDAAHVVEGDAD